MQSYIERYLAGEQVQVWAELLALGQAIRDDPLCQDAQAVARETMRRVRVNVKILTKRLAAYGYAFADAPFPRWQAPHATVAAQIAALEKLVGPIPLSFRACYAAVGAVNFMGTHPTFDHREGDVWDALPDPLVIEPIESAIADCRERLEDPDPEWRWHLPIDVPIAPDSLHKANISGGGPYGFLAPDGAADCLLREDWHGTSFVNYLRLCFRWGGFPGLERYTDPPIEVVASLTRGLLPI